jgi:hypothetical protein
MLITYLPPKIMLIPLLSPTIMLIMHLPSKCCLFHAARQ